MSTDIRQSLALPSEMEGSDRLLRGLEAFCDEILLHNKHMDGVHAWIRDAAPRVFGRAFRDAFHQKYGCFISQKELRLVETMGVQTGYAIQTYAVDQTPEQITAFAKAMICRQMNAYSDEDEDED